VQIDSLKNFLKVKGEERQKGINRINSKVIIYKPWIKGCLQTSAALAWNQKFPELY
jgi:hypothetical protein